MSILRLRTAAVVVAMALPLGACESVFGPEDTALRVSMDSQVGSRVAASLVSSLAPSESRGPGNRPGNGPGNGPVSLESIQSINVGVSQVLILPGAVEAAVGEEEGEESSWVSLNVTATELDLLALKDQQTLAELSADAGISGPIAAVRLVFGASSVTFKDGSTAPLFIPSGKVTLETPGLAVDEATTTLPLTFLQSASVKKIIRTGRGLLMPPVFNVAGAVQEGAGES